MTGDPHLCTSRRQYWELGNVMGISRTAEISVITDTVITTIYLVYLFILFISLLLRMKRIH